MKKQRISLLDTLRGACILLMIYHHASFLIIYYGFYLNTPIYKAARFIRSDTYKLIWLCYVSLFFVIAGICCHISGNNVKRAYKVLLGAMAVSAVTFALYPEEFISFGVLHCMAVCMLIFALIKKTGANKYLFSGITFFLYPVLFAVWYFSLGNGVYCDYSGFPVLGYIATALGFPQKGFMSLDYFPLLPWVFIFFAGVSLGGIMKNHENLRVYGLEIKPLSFFGRHSLIIYLVHQPIILALFYLLSLIPGI